MFEQARNLYNKVMGPDYIRTPLEKKPAVLIIEDDPFSQKLFSNILTQHAPDVQLHIAQTFDEALEMIMKVEALKLIIIDVFLGEGRTGADLFKFVSKLKPDIPVIMTSALDERRFMDLLGKIPSPPPFLRKPFHPDLCAALVENYLQEDKKNE